MSNATEMIEQSQKDRNQYVFEHRIEDFLKKYAPSDPWLRGEFDRDLLFIVRQIFEEAQAPILKQLTQVINALPMSRIL